MSIQTIILEDEARSLSVISNLIRQFTSDIDVIGSAGWVEKSVQLISEKTPQLVFMDIQLADGTGFDVLKRVGAREFEVIFVTAYENYAVNALRAEAIDYLLKPIGIPEFEEAVGRARDKIQEKRRRKNPPVQRKVAIATLSGYEFIDVKDILWCCSKAGYTHFFCTDGVKIISSRNLGFYEELLYAQNFYRIHNSSIINLAYIKNYIKAKTSYVVLTDGTRLEISQRRKGEFMEMFFPTE
jgi:two-component system LytT family response regulator